MLELWVSFVVVVGGSALAWLIVDRINSDNDVDDEFSYREGDDGNFYR